MKGADVASRQVCRLLLLYSKGRWVFLFHPAIIRKEQVTPVNVCLHPVLLHLLLMHGYPLLWGARERSVCRQRDSCFSWKVAGHQVPAFTAA